MKLNLPPHECSLSIAHNQPRNYYQTVQEYINDPAIAPQWRSPEQRQQAIDTNEIWEVMWFPNTPIAHYYIAAPTLDEALEFANEIASKNK